jgi:hypothetical protein
MTNWTVRTSTTFLVGLFVLCGCSQPEPSEPGGSSAGSSATESAVTGSSKPPATLVYDGTMSGVVGDSMCGKDHMMMGDVGKDVVKCTIDCVKEGYKYVLINAKGESFVLADQKAAEEYAGKSVSVSGHINCISKTIDAKSIKAE